MFKIIQGVPVLGLRQSKEGCSCLCAAVKHVLRTDQPLSDQQQQAQVHCVQLLLQVSEIVSPTNYIWEHSPVPVVINWVYNICFTVFNRGVFTSHCHRSL